MALAAESDISAPLSPPRVTISTKKMSNVKVKYGNTSSTGKLPFPLKVATTAAKQESKREVKQNKLSYSVKYAGENRKGSIGVSTVRSPIPTATSSNPKSPPVRTVRQKHGDNEKEVVKSDLISKNDVKEATREIGGLPKTISVRKYHSKPRECLPSLNVDAGQPKEVLELFDEFTLDMSGSSKGFRGHKISTHSPPPEPPPPPISTKRPQSASYIRENGLLRSEFTTGIAANANTRRKFAGDTQEDRPRTAGSALHRENVVNSLSYEKALLKNNQIYIEKISKRQLVKSVASVPYMVHDTLRGCKIVDPHQKESNKKYVFVPINNRGSGNGGNQEPSPKKEQQEEMEKYKDNEHVKDIEEDEEEAISMKNELDPSPQLEEDEDEAHRNQNSDNRSRTSKAKSIFSLESDSVCVSIPLTSAQELIMRSHGWEEAQVDNSKIHQQNGKNGDMKLASSAILPNSLFSVSISSSEKEPEVKVKGRRKSSKEVKDQHVVRPQSRPNSAQAKRSNIKMNPMEEAKENAMNALAYFERKQNELKKLDELNNCIINHTQANEVKINNKRVDNLNIIPTFRETGERRRQAREEFSRGEPLSNKMIRGLPMSLKPDEGTMEQDRNTPQTKTVNRKGDLFHLLAEADRSQFDLVNGTGRKSKGKSKGRKGINNAFTFQGPSEPYLEYLRASDG